MTHIKETTSATNQIKHGSFSYIPAVSLISLMLRIISSLKHSARGLHASNWIYPCTNT